MTSITIPDSVNHIGEYVFRFCDSLKDVYYEGSEQEWAQIFIDSSNYELKKASIHYNSTMPDTPTKPGYEPDDPYAVGRLTSYDSNKKQAVLDGDELTVYHVTEETDQSFLTDIEKLIGKYVLVTYTCTAPEETILLRDIKTVVPVETIIGTVETIEDTDNSYIIINGRKYPVPPSWAPVSYLNNMLCLCCVYQDTIIMIKPAEYKTGKLNRGLAETVVIDGNTYPIMTDGLPPYMSAIDMWLEHTVEYWLVDGIVYKIQLPDYTNEQVKQLTAFNNNTATFHDDSQYQLAATVTTDVTQLVGRWVTLKLTTSAEGGSEITDISLAKPEVSVDVKIEPPVNGKLIYTKNKSFIYNDVEFAKDEFKLKFKVRVASNFPDASAADLELMKTDETLNTSISGLTVDRPDGFDRDFQKVEDFSLAAGEVREIEGSIKPKWFFGISKTESSVTKTIDCHVTVSDTPMDARAYFDIENEYNYDDPTSEPVYDTAEIEESAKKAAKELEKNDNANIIWQTDRMKQAFGLDYDLLKLLGKEIISAVLLSSAPEETYQEEVDDEALSEFFGKYKIKLGADGYTVPLKYIIKTEDNHNLTVQFNCNVSSFDFEDSRIGLIATVRYKILNGSVPLYIPKEDFAGSIAFTDCKAFTKAAWKVAEEELKEAYKKAEGNAIDKIADIILSKTIQDILKAFDKKTSDILWDLMTWPTTNLEINCPTDVFVCDASGKQCGAIENNTVTQKSDDFELEVYGDTKYITGLDDRYTVKYKATDNGTMDVTVVEFMGYDEPLRMLEFNDVPLRVGVKYSQELPDEKMSEASIYKLVSSDTTIVPDVPANTDKDLLELGGINGGTGDETGDGTGGETNNGTGGGSSGGGGSLSSNKVSVVSSSNGSVTMTPKTPKKGDTVTVTAKPDEGYALNTLKVADSSGKAIDVTKLNDNEFTFVMPTGDVTVTPVFAELTPEPQKTETAFTDVPADAYYADAVAWAVSQGITNGTSGTTFSPGNACTRAQMVTFLWRSAGSPPPKNKDNPFADVMDDAYYYDAVLWAVEHGITTGTSATSFSPEDTVTRGQTVTFIHRAAGTPETSAANPFTDVAANVFYSKAAIWAAEQDITKGTTGTTFSPNDNCTRGQIVTFLYRAA